MHSPSSNVAVAEEPSAGHYGPHSELPRSREAPAPPEPRLRRVEWAKFGALIVELVGLGCLIQRYDIESAAFFAVFLLTGAGFAVQYHLPLRFRFSAFLAVSVASIVLVLGPVQGAWLIALGLGLIGAAHLPFAFAVRVGLLLVIGAAFAALRAGWGATPWSAAIWPVLGAMFMFRLIVYMYDLKHGQAPAGWTPRLGYFFMLPNVCFPLFPVVDSRLFVRSHFAGERHDIHQRGVEWILRGLIQLILYRIAHKQLVIDPYDVGTAADLVHYFLWLFLLYLRVSGQFHVIAGILHLFGFHLAETHRLYYFASSFTDFWRRINIYWKDFMMKVFYYPMFFGTKRLGPTRALVISTAFVFLATWALHAYQLFWIRGTYTFTWNDLLFWTILCGLVTVNALWEARHGRRRSLSPRQPTWRDQMSLFAKTLATFTAICVLWSFWSSESLGAWFSLWPAALVPPTPEQMRMIPRIGAAAVFAIAGFVAWRRWMAPRIEARWRWRVVAVLVQLLILNAVSVTGVYSRWGAAGQIVAKARFGGLNRAELGQLERGYYEDLLTVDRFNGELAALYARRPANWTNSLADAGLLEPAEGLQGALRANAEAEFCGAMLRTNQWGMHDQEYDRQKPARCFRIALLGASHTMGSGVEREKTFDAVLEARLNREHDRSPFDKIEVLNFAVYGYNPVEQSRVIETRAEPFDPDLVLFVGHPGDAGRAAQFVGRLVKAGADLDDPGLAEVARRAGVDRAMPDRMIQWRLKPFGEQILSHVYRRMAALCRTHGMRPVFVLLPMVPGSAPTNERSELSLAETAGFATLDLSDVYKGHDWHTLAIAEWDAHPNATGHRLVGNRLFELLTRNYSSLIAASP
jgi:hypothetical protein